MNVFKDGSQQKGFMITTDKKEPTIQELDLKTRKVIQNQYKIYNSETGNIQKDIWNSTLIHPVFIMIYLILKGNIV